MTQEEMDASEKERSEESVRKYAGMTAESITAMKRKEREDWIKEETEKHGFDCIDLIFGED